MKKNKVGCWKPKHEHGKTHNHAETNLKQVNVSTTQMVAPQSYGAYNQNPNMVPQNYGVNQ